MASPTTNQWAENGHGSFRISHILQQQTMGLVEVRICFGLVVYIIVIRVRVSWKVLSVCF